MADEDDDRGLADRLYTGAMIGAAILAAAVIFALMFVDAPF